MTTSRLEADSQVRDTVRDNYRRYLSRGRAKLGDMFGGHVEVGSEGPWVHTSDGGRFLNAGGYGVFLHGARHPAVVAAVIAQIQSHPIATRLLLEPSVGDAAAALVAVAPPGLTRVHFAGSGAEAVEAAIKMARAHGRRRLVSAVGGYHGKTMGALSVTGQNLYQQPFRPLLPDVTHVPYGDAEALGAALAGGPPACVILEPVQGEGGVVIPPPGYLREASRLCRQHGAFLVLDEILTGVGRLGHWWGADREDVRPDVLLAGKSLSGGIVPVSAVIATADAFNAFDKDPFLHTSTFSGAPIAMAATRAAIAAVTVEGLVDRAAKLGAELLSRLQAVAAPYPHLVREVRGVGLLIGVEFAGPGLAGEAILELLSARVIVNHSMIASTVLRLTPPAVLSGDEVALLVEAFDSALRTLGHRYPTAHRLGVH
ncbi:aspartate aminotransferase family protein [Micromonospora ureilytica]|uniref:aspartate aminotransferase family protein n=1 Tax=Micromonospora ureilytica TaxID=709868 RepID=UPI002E10D2FF|nr:aminotransferase class III-fold pyridoxal phosphate-dependent enzyme [Micromonospora ureilytica]